MPGTLSDEQAAALARVKQARATEEQLREELTGLKPKLDVHVYRAVRVEKVPVTVVAEALGLTRARIYQMTADGAELDDQQTSAGDQ